MYTHSFEENCRLRQSVNVTRTTKIQPFPFCLSKFLHFSFSLSSPPPSRSLLNFFLSRAVNLPRKYPELLLLFFIRIAITMHFVLHRHCVKTTYISSGRAFFPIQVASVNCLPKRKIGDMSWPRAFRRIEGVSSAINFIRYAYECVLYIFVNVWLLNEHKITTKLWITFDNRVRYKWNAENCSDIH